MHLQGLALRGIMIKTIIGGTVMKKKALLIPAAAACAAAVYLALRKSGLSVEVTVEKDDKKNPSKNAASDDLTVGTYSFVSGFKDAATVDVNVSYDADRFDFNVVEEGFLCSTSDSHVAVMYGADFNVQLEYVPFYAGDCFDSVRENAKSNPGFAEISEGFRYVDGDSVYTCLPVDDFSYLLVTAMLSKGSELKFEELPDVEELKKLIGAIKVGAAR